MSPDREVSGESLLPLVTAVCVCMCANSDANGGGKKHKQRMEHDRRITTDRRQDRGRRNEMQNVPDSGIKRERGREGGIDKVRKMGNERGREFA